MDNNDYRDQLEEIMRNEGMDNDEFMKKILDAQETIMQNADRLMMELTGAGDISEIMNMPVSEQSRIFKDLNEKLSEMTGFDLADYPEDKDSAAEREEYKSMLESIEVPDELLEELKKYRRNSIYIGHSEAEVHTGCSKTGGIPDVYEGFEWVRNSEGNPLTFLMQINCEEIHPFDRDNIFPEKGMLYFFYDFDSEPWETVENGHYVCYYDGVISELRPCEFPGEPAENSCCYAEGNCVIDEKAVEFFAADDLPEYDDNYEAAEEYTYEEYEGARYRILGYDPFEYSEKYFKLGGYSNSIQCGLSDVFDESFVQLCQLTTFESGKCGFMFGDGGNLYFYIKKEDLRNREFGSTEIVLQCY